MSDIKRPMSHSNMPEDDFSGQSNNGLQPAKESNGWVVKVIIFVLVIIVLLGGLFAVSKYTPWNILNLSKGNSTASAKGWEAIFLTNGQVYFGRIVKQSNDTIDLKDIYYLQVTGQIQPAPENQAAAAQQEQQLSLVKLGDELHGPKDYMVINRNQVLFTEELKEDSKVVDAIKRYIEEQAAKK